MSFKGKVAVVTGAGQGIGRATALLFAKDGAEVFAADCNESAGRETVAQIAKLGGQARYVYVDIAHRTSVDQMFDEVLRIGGKLDCLVNNAAVATNLRTEEVTEQIISHTLDVNIKGTFYCCQRALAQMKTQGFGKIVNVSSGAGQHGGMVCGGDYAASKGAILALTKRLAKEFGPYNICVNAVAPGMIETPMNANVDDGYEEIAKNTPLRRIGKPDEVGAAIQFLCSEEASFITGATLDVNGGVYMR